MADGEARQAKVIDLIYSKKVVESLWSVVDPTTGLVRSITHPGLRKGQPTAALDPGLGLALPPAPATATTAAAPPYIAFPPRSQTDILSPQQLFALAQQPNHCVVGIGRPFGREQGPYALVTMHIDGMGFAQLRFIGRDINGAEVALPDSLPRLRLHNFFEGGCCLIGPFRGRSRKEMDQFASALARRTAEAKA